MTQPYPLFMTISFMDNKSDPVYVKTDTIGTLNYLPSLEDIIFTYKTIDL